MMLTKTSGKRILILFCLTSILYCIIFSYVIMNIDSNSSKLHTSEKLIFEEEAVFSYLDLTKSYLEQ